VSEAVVIGLGQLGRVFAGGLLRAGRTVVPVNRDDDMAALVQRHPAPERLAKPTCTRYWQHCPMPGSRAPR